jgi:hypothetical protein
MTEQQQHPINPPPVLVQQWMNLPLSTEECLVVASQWGWDQREPELQKRADQELDACCEWLHWQNLATHPDLIPSLRAARRPKPPSLKVQALEAAHIELDAHGKNGSLIIRALEALPDD